MVGTLYSGLIIGLTWEGCLMLLVTLALSSSVSLAMQLSLKQPCLDNGAATSGQWSIRRCSYHLRTMIARIHDVPAPLVDAERDKLLWRHGEDDYKAWFSSSRT